VFNIPLNTQSSVSETSFSCPLIASVMTIKLVATKWKMSTAFEACCNAAVFWMANFLPTFVWTVSFVDNTVLLRGQVTRLYRRCYEDHVTQDQSQTTSVKINDNISYQDQVDRRPTVRFSSSSFKNSPVRDD